MNQRLIWNFEFCEKKSSSQGTLEFVLPLPQEVADLKWEIRLFWPSDQIITLYKSEDSLLDLTHYRHKYKEDYYYLLTENNDNIKRRGNKLLYKPLLQGTPYALGYGKKIEREFVPSSYEEVYVQKEAFLYSFATQPKTKLELARLKVRNQHYFSLCIEGKSLSLVKRISSLLLKDPPIPCDYVTFLKDIIKS